MGGEDLSLHMYHVDESRAGGEYGESVERRGRVRERNATKIDRVFESSATVQ